MILVMKQNCNALGCLLLLSVLLLFGCASSGMSSEQQDQIPDGANEVVLRSELPPSDLYKQAYEVVRKAGLRMEESNDEMHSFSTSGGPVGESGSVIRVDVLVEERESGSQLVGRADVRISGFGWMRASKAGKNSEPRVGFEELVLLLKDMPHEQISYREQ